MADYSGPTFTVDRVHITLVGVNP